MQGLRYVNNALGLLFALALAIVGLVVVRPVHGTAGMILAAGGAARFLGLGFMLLLFQVRDSAGLTSQALGTFNTVLSLGMTLCYWGAIGAAAWMLTQELAARGGKRA